MTSGRPQGSLLNPFPSLLQCSSKCGGGFTALVMAHKLAPLLILKLSLLNLVNGTKHVAARSRERFQPSGSGRSFTYLQLRDESRVQSPDGRNGSGNWCLSVFKLDELGLEILRITLPVSLALTADSVFLDRIFTLSTRTQVRPCLPGQAQTFKHGQEKQKEQEQEGAIEEEVQDNTEEKDPGIPNDWPFKEQELKALEARRQRAIQEQEEKKAARKERRLYNRVSRRLGSVLLVQQQSGEEMPFFGAGVGKPLRFGAALEGSRDLGENKWILDCAGWDDVSIPDLNQSKDSGDQVGNGEDQSTESGDEDGG
ncbi:unnamed protein product [Fraxinus pennsylvanica]|uniref:Guanine nucleotide-binding protein-like 3 N-terminal domain-containing protein n=1 Tax=Fraxinus pennsylvanica TaxID=56036 RepID=A0AAD2A266_9LAMI|nr:unnamed protein product [Fraxinus pennsylvanica]